MPLALGVVERAVPPPVEKPLVGPRIQEQLDGKAVSWLKNYYREKTGLSYQVIALGDSENDISMLELADIAVLIKSPVKAFPALRSEKIFYD